MKSIFKLATAPVAIGFALVAMPAFAQTAPADDTTADDANGPAIVVTGSRLASPNLQSTSPVTVVTAEEIKNTGTTRVEDLVNSLPQVFASQGANYSNGASGAANLNLRGLGSERTLVLVNGRRLVPGDPTTSAADINVIPGAMVKRIDILTGGASAVYGADAVAGVVNFVMDTNFEGFKVDGQYSFYDHNNRGDAQYVDQLNTRGFPFPSGHVADGGTIDTSVAFGAGFDDGHGHVTAYAGYRKVNAITGADRDYSACNLSARGAATSTGSLYTCGGSSTSANGTFFTNLQTLQVGPNRTFIGGRTPFNFAPYNYFQRPDERYTAGLFADYEISPALHPYMEFMFMDDRTVAQIAPSGDFGNTFEINCDNPLMSAQQLALVCQPANLFNAGGTTGGVPKTFIDPTTGLPYFKALLQPLRRNVEGGGRRDDLEHTSYRGVLGIKGDLGPVWSYDAYYQYGRTNFAETYSNDFSVTRLARALDVVDDPRVAGINPICRSALAGTDTNCVPWDIFALNSVSAAALNYLQVPGFQRGVNSEQIVSGALTGDLGKYGIRSPGAKDGVQIALGAEYRKEKLELQTDIEFQTGDLAGQGAPTLPVAGKFDVKEFFSEIKIPLVQDSFFHELSVEGGYRYSDYSVNGRSFSTNTYKLLGEFAPIADIRFRGGYNRAVRAPTLQDYFASQKVGLDGSTDPCAKVDNQGNAVPIAATDLGCIAQGLTAGQTVIGNTANQYNGLTGGNPNLNPEISDTWTAGAVLTPRFLPGFSASIDWFKIKIAGAIQGIGADEILKRCGVTTANAFYCNLVHRDQFGSLWRSSNGYVTDLSQNIGSLSTKGIDFTAGYSRQIGSVGRMSLNFVGTWLDTLVTDGVDCAGLYGNICGTPNPTWRHQLRVGFDMKNGIGASVRWRHFDGVKIDTPTTIKQPALQSIPAVNYFDLALTARVGDHYKFSIGANNLLDKQPPLTGSQACPAGPCNNNTWAQVYDSVGRYIFVGVSLDF
jgi:iron complex outermembrane recepter protein